MQSAFLWSCGIGCSDRGPDGFTCRRGRRLRQQAITSGIVSNANRAHLLATDKGGDLERGGSLHLGEGILELLALGRARSVVNVRLVADERKLVVGVRGGRHFSVVRD